MALRVGHTLLVATLTLLVTFDLTSACSCMMEHPQVHACRSDFVILARILSSKPSKDPSVPMAHYTGYRLKIQQIFKSSPGADEALRYRFITTPSEDSMCGADLRIKQLYLITGSVMGGRAYVNLCNFVRPWNHLSLVQRKGFRREYYQNCDCKVRMCWSRVGECSRGSKHGCGWTTNDGQDNKDCQQKHSICSRNDGGFCAWSDNRYMDHCMTKIRGQHPLLPTYNNRHNNEALEP